MTSDPTIPTFPRHDPASPDFWDVRYRENFAPWDAGGVPTCLREWVLSRMSQSHAIKPAAVLIPGCGAAWEVRFFAETQWPVMAVDFSAEAVAAAQAALGEHGDKVREADFFGPTLAPASFDVIYERAFLSALPRRLWNDWASRSASLLVPGGLLVGFFYADESERGPPFGLKPGELDMLLSPAFDLIESRMPTDSIPVFKGKETWMVWRRR